MNWLYNLSLSVMAVDESPQDRHARLLREASEAFALKIAPDAAGDVELAAQLHSEFASATPFGRLLSEVSPHAHAALIVATISVVALLLMSWLIALPVRQAKRA